MPGPQGTHLSTYHVKPAYLSNPRVHGRARTAQPRPQHMETAASVGALTAALLY